MNKGKIRKIEGPLSLEGRHTKPQAARALNFQNAGEEHTIKLNKDLQFISMLKTHDLYG